MKPLYSKYFWNWHHQNYWVVDWQHICYVMWTYFSTDSRLVSTRLKHTSIRGFLKRNENKIGRSFNFAFGYKDDGFHWLFVSLSFYFRHCSHCVIVVILSVLPWLSLWHLQSLWFNLPVIDTMEYDKQIYHDFVLNYMKYMCQTTFDFVWCRQCRLVLVSVQ